MRKDEMKHEEGSDMYVVDGIYIYMCVCGSKTGITLEFIMGGS